MDFISHENVLDLSAIDIHTNRTERTLAAKQLSCKFVMKVTASAVMSKLFTND